MSNPTPRRLRLTTEMSNSKLKLTVSPRELFRVYARLRGNALTDHIGGVGGGRKGHEIIRTQLFPG